MPRTHLAALAFASALVAGLASDAQAARRQPTPAFEQRNGCAVKELSSTDEALVEAAIAEVEQSGQGAVSGQVVIPVYFHVITTATGGANVASLVPAQMSVLNAAYAGSGFQFDLKSVDVTANDAWFYAEQGSAEEQQMKATLRKGGIGDLNIYTTNGDVYLGWATYPIYYQRIRTFDGVVLYWATLPGTGFVIPWDPAEEPDGNFKYDGGDTATHEVGHWLGLPHTFANGCNEPGDFSKDTPAEAGPQFYCVQRDSCTQKKNPGYDPITNYMDYVDDDCMYQFTSDQQHRMQKQWKAFRDRTTY